MSRLVTVPLDHIDPNPHRDLSTYPWIEKKIEQLQRSINDLGLWEGVIARPSPKRENFYQLAFGHHRVEAARRVKLTEARLIIRALSDADMLKFMGRENAEEYGADFLTMLNTWDAAVDFVNDNASQLVPNGTKQAVPVIQIARFLGWTTERGSENRSDDSVSLIARACAAAHSLIRRGYLDRRDLLELSVGQARELLERAQARAVTLDEREVDENTKKRFSHGVRTTIENVRNGRIAQRDIREAVDAKAWDVLKPKQKSEPPPPLFTAFADELLQALRTGLERDTAAANLARVEQALPHITLAKDKEIVADIQHELGKIEARAAEWGKRLTLNKVTSFRVLERRED